MNRRSLPVAAALAVLLASCSDRPTELAPSGDIPQDFLQPTLSVLDGTHEGGNEHFFWLPPLGDSKKGFDGVADPSQLPAVEICLRDDAAADGCAAGQPLVARFTRTSGEDSDRIVVDGKDEYFVHWRMNDFPPQRDGQYRIRVLIQGTELGHADVITMRQREVKAYNGDLIAISDNGAFKIGFRIEEGALCSQGALACTTGIEIPGDGQPTVVQVPAQTVGGDQVVAAVITVNDAVFEDVNGNPIPDVVVSASVRIDPPSMDVLTDDTQEIPFFVEIKTFPSDVYIDPNGPGVEVVICQDEDVLAARNIAEPLHQWLILYKVSSGTTKRLVSTYGAPECAGTAPVPAPGLMGMLKRGASSVFGFVGPQPLVARRRLHGGLNTVIRRSSSDAEAFSIFGAALGPEADSSFAVLPAAGTVGTPVPVTIQLRNALGQNILLPGDTLEVTVRGSNPTATFTATNSGGGIYAASYTPAAPGIDSLDIVLIRNDGVGLGAIGGSPYVLPVTGPAEVSNTNDAGPGSLRQAILNTNLSPGPNDITFNIPGGGPHVIALTSALPNLTDPVVIDATTQPGYAGTPIVEINGSAYAAGPNTGYGFSIQTSDVTLRGMAITGQPRSGIFTGQGTSNLVVEDNYIGTNGAGGPGGGNATAGLRFRSSNSWIRNNVLSGNTQNGILLELGATGDSIYGNTIGLAPNGTDPLPNGWTGITMYAGVTGTVIRNNTISGNATWGIDIQHSGALAPVVGTIIEANVIGLDANGDVVRTGPGDLVDGAINYGPVQRGNGAGGIRTNNAPGTVIGGPGGGNTISGNTGDGIRLLGPAASPAVVVRGNFVGTDPSGSAARANTENGVSAYASGVVVGGPTAADRNVISGNISDGVETGGGATGVVVEGNYVGVDAGGSAPLGNGLYYGALEGCCHTGIFVRSGNNTVRGNVVSANWLGIRSGDSGGGANLIENNLVGTDAGGTADLGNLTDGIGLYGDKSGTHVRGNTIRFNGQGVTLVEGTEGALVGGASGEGNVISNNDGTGVNVGYDVLSGDVGNTLRRNSIVDNGGLGIDLAGNGLTANDALDADSGPNDLVNRPELLGALNGVGAGVTQVSLTLNAAPGTVYGVEFFANAACDASGAGEGGTPVLFAAAPGATDGSGQLTYSVDVPAVANGQVITATATDPTGNTSEFSNCVTVSVALGNIWSPTASMGASGLDLASTLLSDGRVLVVGLNTPSAEVYDPTSGTWSTVPAPFSIGFGPAATMLADGRVLVSGGASGGGTSAAIFDPVTDLFTTVGSLNVGRRYHAQALLPDGRVLVAGGYGPAHIASLEIFDPGTSTFTLAPVSLSSGRVQPLAAVLPSGKVLLAGGSAPTICELTADLYDPVANTLTPVPGSMTSCTHNGGAVTLSDGRVFLIGSGSVGQLYDPVANAFSATGALTEPRHQFAVANMADGRVMVTGGVSQISGMSIASTEIYDPGTGTFSAGPSMVQDRLDHSATLLLDGRILVMGGVSLGGAGILASAELYIP